MGIVSKIKFNNMLHDIADSFARKQLNNYEGTDRTATLDNDTVNVSGDHTLVAGDESRTAENITDHANNVLEISSPDLRLKSTGRVMIGNLIDGYRRKLLPLRDNNNSNYNVVVESDTTDEMLADQYIMVGDSYGTGLTPTGEKYGWPVWCAWKLGLPDEKWENVSLGGIGFSTSPSFLDRLKTAKTDPKKVKGIIVAGGYNEANANQSEIQIAVEQFITYAVTQYPYATVYVAMIGTSSDYNRNISDNLFNNTFIAYYTGTIGSGKRSVFLETPTWTMKDYVMMSSDSIHPTEYGYKVLGYNIASAILTGQGTAVMNLRAFSIQSLGGGIQDCTINNINTFRFGDTTYVVGGQIVISTVDFTWKGNDPLVCCTLNKNGLILGSSFDYVCGWPCIAYIQNQSGQFTMINVRAYIVNGAFCIRNDNASGGGFTNYEHVKDITLRFVTTAIPTAYC